MTARQQPRFRRLPLSALLAVVTFLVSLIFLFGDPDPDMATLSASIAVSAAAGVVVWLSGRAPAVALAAVAALTVALPLLGTAFEVLDIAIVFVVFQVTVRTAIPWPLLAVVSLVLLHLADLQQRMPLGRSFFEPALLYPAVLTALAVGFGLQTRRARDQQAELTTLRAAEQRRALVEERQRISRDVHDIAAHHLSALIVHNALAERLGTVDALQEAARFSSVTAKEALDSLREVVAILTVDEGAPRHPAEPDAAPTGAPRGNVEPSSLDGLMERARRAGLEIDAVIDDAALDDDSRRGAVGRIVQEALSNVLLHRGPGPVTVRVRASEAEIEVLVEDDGRGRGDPGPATEGAGGHGMSGMRARAEALGGRFEAGPAAGGGWRVRARLPLDAARP